MATLTENQKKQLFQQLKPWSVNFLAWRNILYGTGNDIPRLLDNWYKTNIASQLPIWQVGYGPQTYPVSITLPKKIFLQRVRYIGPGSNSGKNAIAYRESGDAQADKDAIIKYQTEQLDLLMQLRASVTGILSLALGSNGSSVALASLDAIINLMNTALTTYKNGPVPSL